MRAFVAILAMVLCGCGVDVVSHSYSNMEQARADGLFDKGWLPDILPPSSVNIRTDNDVSANNSTGSFEFGAGQAPQLFSKLARGAPPGTYFANWNSTVEGFRAKEYSAWTYRDAGYTWAFFCAPTNDRCEYFLWPTRHGV